VACQTNARKTIKSDPKAIILGYKGAFRRGMKILLSLIAGAL